MTDQDRDYYVVRLEGCPICHSTGEVEHLGFLHECNTCHGRGRVPAVYVPLAAALRDLGVAVREEEPS